VLLIRLAEGVNRLTLVRETFSSNLGSLNLGFSWFPVVHRGKVLNFVYFLNALFVMLRI
jgi:hypothetical protein